MIVHRIITFEEEGGVEIEVRVSKRTSGNDAEPMDKLAGEITKKIEDALLGGHYSTYVTGWTDR